MNSLLDHFRDPNNVGEVEEPNGTARAGSLICGAVVQVTLGVDEEKKITSARFKAAGCTYLIGICSVLTEAVTGKSSADAAAVLRSIDHPFLSDIPSTNHHCLELALNTILSAIRNYSDSVRAEWHGEDALICSCFGISEQRIEQAIDSENFRTVADVTQVTNAGRGCGSCYNLIEDILDNYRARELK
jgi:NifU-like protein